MLPSRRGEGEQRRHPRATEYSKGATKGDWNTVWSSFDKRKKAKAANEQEAEADDGPGLFGEDAGVQAAE